MCRPLLAAAFASLAALSPATAQPEHDAFTPLFNSKDLSGWWGMGTEDPAVVAALAPEALADRQRASLEDIHAHWRVDEGVLINDGQGLYLTTFETFADFELRLDFLCSPGADSGVYLRACPQVQIWDPDDASNHPNGSHLGSGGLWNNPEHAPGKNPSSRADAPIGQWNTYRIVMVGERVTVELNGVRVVDHARLHNYFNPDAPIPRAGPIQLQTHGREMRWRNIAIREIASDEANAILASHDAQGFNPIFNGRDFTGWSGPTDGYEVHDSLLRCKPGHGGTIYADPVYADFQARLEIRLPPGGNNGLAIRYPGEGDTAYVGMCELQVLDNDDPRFASLDPRQYHASAYGQAAAHRGYLRPAGEWNFQQVTVVGPRITVELNGTTILDADLAANTDFMYEPEKFEGRFRAEGHFGFAGHNDPVEFRNISVRELAPAPTESPTP